MSLSDHKFLILGAVAAGVGLFILVKAKGVADLIEPLAETAGEVAVQAVSGVATGVVTGISKGVGLPTPSETITDAQECKRYLDANGYWAASAHCSLPAFAQAITM